MAFENDPLPINIINAGLSAVVGGPTFQTTIVTGSGGDEQRNGKSRHARRQFRINTEILEADDLSDLYAHFQARRGSTDSFPFLDPFDYTASGEPLVSIGGGNYQMTKKYSFDGVDYYRPITLPINGTVSLSSGGTPNYSTGVVAGGAGGTWSGQFYIPARYDSDALSNVYSLPMNASASCGIIEVWDSDIPALTNAAPPARLGSSFPLSIDLGIDNQQNWSTRIASTGWMEDRQQDFAAERVIFRNAVGHVKTEAELDSILSLFLIARGRRSGFLYGGLDFRFGTDSLVLERTGYGTYRAYTPLVRLNA